MEFYGAPQRLKRSSLIELEKNYPALPLITQKYIIVNFPFLLLLPSQPELPSLPSFAAYVCHYATHI